MELAVAIYLFAPMGAKYSWEARICSACRKVTASELRVPVVLDMVCLSQNKLPILVKSYVLLNGVKIRAYRYCLAEVVMFFWLGRNLTSWPSPRCETWTRHPMR
jgi:hypothetical protein